MINALQLGRQANPPAPKLVEAIVADGVVAVDGVDPGPAVGSPALKRFAIALGIAALIAVLYFWLVGPGAAISRSSCILRPVVGHPPASPGPDSTSRPTAPSASSKARRSSSKRRPPAASPPRRRLTWMDNEGHRRTLHMSPVIGEDHAFAYTFPSVDSAFEFFVTAGDARSLRVSVTIEPRPRITKMSVSYHYPAYTALPDRNVDDFDGHLHGLPTTIATLTLATNKLYAGENFRYASARHFAGPRRQARPRCDPAHPGRARRDLVESHDRHRLQRRVLFSSSSTSSGNSVEDGNQLHHQQLLEQDMPPVIGFSKPGRDIQVKDGDTVEFALMAQDDFGLGPMKMVGRVANEHTPAGPEAILGEWPNIQPQPQRRIEVSLKKTTAELGLKPGDRMEYWAVATDRNNISADGPGKSESQHYNIMVLTPEQAQTLMEQQLIEYARALTELIRLQRDNRTQTEAYQEAPPLVDRENMIRRSTQQLADLMQRNAFAAQTIIDDLQSLASGPMVKAISLLEGYRDSDPESGKESAAASLPVQDAIIEKLVDILKRINRDQAVRADLKRIAQTDPTADNHVKTALSKLGKDLDQFLAEQRDLKDKYEKMAKHDGDDVKGEDAAAPQRRQAPAGPLEAVAQGFRRRLWQNCPRVSWKDSALAETLPPIFEDVEKKPRGPLTEVATPLEEGMKVVERSKKCWKTSRSGRRTTPTKRRW